MQRTFDRRVYFDERSRNYPISELVAGKTPRSYKWRCRTTLDQGDVGACVGFAWAHELAAKPDEWPVSYDLAMSIYHQAQTLDDTPGENYEGTTVLAGAKAVVADHWDGAYRWAFSIDDLILAIGYEGPAVLGINWYNDMMEPDGNGFVTPTGGVAGGHAILCRAVNIAKGHFTLHNSWGPGWGVNGDCHIRIADLESLLQDQGEACIPERRAPVTATV